MDSHIQNYDKQIQKQMVSIIIIAKTASHKCKQLMNHLKYMNRKNGCCTVLPDNTIEPVAFCGIWEVKIYGPGR